MTKNGMWWHVIDTYTGDTYAVGRKAEMKKAMKELSLTKSVTLVCRTYR